MKTSLRTAVIALSSGWLSLTLFTPALGGESKPAEHARTYSGIVSAVDQNEKTLSVKTWLASRSFNIGEDCKVSLEDKPAATVADVHPGQKIEVSYEEVAGVRVAHGIAQHNLSFKGHVTELDSPNHTITVRDSGLGKTFALAPECKVVLNHDRAGIVNDLKPGQFVTVIYEDGKQRDLACRIEQRSETYVGTIRALDAGARTVKARTRLSERKFNLADDCSIVIEGHPDAHLSDLHIGDRVVISYEDKDGIAIVSRIGREPTAGETETAQTARTAD